MKVFQAPRSVSAKHARGGYLPVDPAEFGAGRMVRIGSYGDPMAVPAHVWESLISRATGHTGYTHQWRRADSGEYSGLCMASADSAQEQRDALGRGMRTFRVLQPGESLTDGEIRCPASKEAGQKSTCAKCGLCAGTRSASRKTIAIEIH